jgi:hypothetical protein
MVRVVLLGGRELFLAIGFGGLGVLLVLHVDITLGLVLRPKEERGCDG